MCSMKSLFSLVKEAGYEVREFPRTYWVTTDGISTVNPGQGNSAFDRLFNYISGENAEGAVRKQYVPYTYSNQYMPFLCIKDGYRLT